MIYSSIKLSIKVKQLYKSTSTVSHTKARRSVTSTVDHYHQVQFKVPGALIGMKVEYDHDLLYDQQVVDLTLSQEHLIRINIFLMHVHPVWQHRLIAMLKLIMIICMKNRINPISFSQVGVRP